MVLQVPFLPSASAPCFPLILELAWVIRLTLLPSSPSQLPILPPLALLVPVPAFLPFHHLSSLSSPFPLPSASPSPPLQDGKWLVADEVRQRVGLLSESSARKSSGKKRPLSSSLPGGGANKKLSFSGAFGAKPGKVLPGVGLVRDGPGTLTFLLKHKAAGAGQPAGGGATAAGAAAGAAGGGGSGSGFGAGSEAEKAVRKGGEAQEVKTAVIQSDRCQ